jgi:hypothetical protein
MPGKRTDLISRRDVEVLDFIARFGVVPQGAVASWAGTARSVTGARQMRLRKAGLVVVNRGFGDSGPLLTATRSGLRACGRGELSPARVSPGLVRHESIVASLAAAMERHGVQLLSEREILARERAEGSRVLSAAISGGRFHRADMVRVDRSGNALEAIEVELTAKKKERLDELLRAWRRVVGQGRVGWVTYRCPPHTRRLVERAVERTKTDGVVSVEELWSDKATEKDETGS